MLSNIIDLLADEIINHNYATNEIIEMLHNTLIKKTNNASKNVVVNVCRYKYCVSELFIEWFKTTDKYTNPNNEWYCYDLRNSHNYDPNDVNLEERELVGELIEDFGKYIIEKGYCNDSKDYIAIGLLFAHNSFRDIYDLFKMKNYNYQYLSIVKVPIHRNYEIIRTLNINKYIMKN